MMDCAGGQKDLGTFNLYFGSSENLPPDTSISHEGIYYQYFFETGKEEKEIFAAQFTTSVSPDPLSGKPEYYLGIGLNSKFDGEGIREFGRKPLNLVVLLDVSGSMGGEFGDGKSKIEIAKETLYSLLDQLHPNDRFGLILFDEKASILHPITLWNETNVADLKKTISEVSVGGSTSLSAGMQAASQALREVKDQEGVYNNRILNLTDAEPTVGDNDSDTLITMMKQAADEKIYKTFIGMGIDFNTDLVEKITKVHASGYFSVESSSEFRKMLNNNFDYFVTPIAFDVSLKIESEIFEVERVYGSPGNEIPAAGECVKMLSLFPSAKEEPTTTKGGIVLVKLQPKGPLPSGSHLQLKTKLHYIDYNGIPHTNEDVISFPNSAEESYSGSGIRKAILLSRYVNLMKHWIRDTSDKKQTPSISMETGILIPALVWSKNGSDTKSVSPHYKELFRKFQNYLVREVEQLEDEKLGLELGEKLSTLLNNTSPKDVKRAFKTIYNDQLLETGDGIKAEEIIKKVSDAFEVTLTSQLEDTITSLLQKKAFDRMETILKNEYIESDKRRLIDPHDLDNFINSRFGQNSLTLLDPNRQRLHTRYNNYIVYEYLYEVSKKIKAAKKEASFPNSVLSFFKELVDASSDVKKLEAEWKISLSQSLRTFLEEAIKTDLSFDNILYKY